MNGQLGLTLREEHRLKVSENGILRRIFGPKREEVAGGWRRLHNEELHNLYDSPNIIRAIIKENEIGVTCSTYERRKMHSRFWSENLKGRDPSENLGVDGRIILEWVGECEVDSWLRIGASGELL
jgi:hypothetical protein